MRIAHETVHRGFETRCPRDIARDGRDTEMALRIERWLGRSRGGAAELWLAQQTAYDLWRARGTLKKTRALATVRSVGHRAA